MTFIPPPPASISSTSPERSLSPDILPPTLLHTESDSFGLFREYTEYPTYEPDKYTSLDDVCDAGTFNTAPAPSRDPESGFGPRKAPQSSSSQFPSSSDSAQNPYAPFPNPSTYHMMKFAYDCQNDNSFGLAGIQRMNDQVIQQPDSIQLSSPASLRIKKPRDWMNLFHHSLSTLYFPSMPTLGGRRLQSKCPFHARDTKPVKIRLQRWKSTMLFIVTFWR